MPDPLTASELHARLGVSVRWVDTLRRRGRLEPVATGPYRYRLEDVERALNGVGRFPYPQPGNPARDAKIWRLVRESGVSKRKTAAKVGVSVGTVLNALRREDARRARSSP